MRVPQCWRILTLVNVPFICWCCFTFFQVWQGKADLKHMRTCLLLLRPGQCCTSGLTDSQDSTIHGMRVCRQAASCWIASRRPPRPSGTTTLALNLTFTLGTRRLPDGPLSGGHQSHLGLPRHLRAVAPHSRRALCGAYPPRCASRPLAPSLRCLAAHWQAADAACCEHLQYIAQLLLKDLHSLKVSCSLNCSSCGGHMQAAGYAVKVLLSAGGKTR